jgi:hypothetical protein
MKDNLIAEKKYSLVNPFILESVISIHFVMAVESVFNLRLILVLFRD